MMEREVAPWGGGRRDHTYQWRICCAPHMSMGYEKGREMPIVGGGVELMYYLSCIEGVSCSTSSHWWGRLYTPFLLREESFTWMCMSSINVLVAPCASLSIMVKHSRSTWCPVVLLCRWMGDGALRCSLNLSPKVMLDSSMYCSGRTVLVWTFVMMITPLSWCKLP